MLRTGIISCFFLMAVAVSNAAEPVAVPSVNHQKALSAKFLPLQNNPQYFKDCRCSKKVDLWEVKRLEKNIDNFGKKIFMKSWSAKDMERESASFGEILSRRTFNYFPEEIADGIAPYIDREVKNLQISPSEKADFEDWFQVFKRWGLSYFSFADRNLMVIVDGQNGNYFQLENKAFFIEEKYQKLIDIIFSYKEKPPMSESERKAVRERQKERFKDLNEKYRSGDVSR